MSGNLLNDKLDSSFLSSGSYSADSKENGNKLQVSDANTVETNFPSAAQFGDGSGDQLDTRHLEAAKKFVKTEKITAGITAPSLVLGVGGIAATLATFFIIGFPPLGLGLALAGGALLIGTGIGALKWGLNKGRAIAENAQNGNIKYPTKEYRRNLRLIGKEEAKKAKEEAKKAKAEARLREAAEAINKNYQSLEEMRQGLKNREENLTELNSSKQKLEEEKTEKERILSEAESDLIEKEKTLETATVKFNYLDVLSEKYTQAKDSLENTKKRKDALQEAFDEQKKAFQETQNSFEEAKKSLDEVLRQIRGKEAKKDQASDANLVNNDDNNNDNDSNINLDLSGNEGLDASVQAMLKQAQKALDEIENAQRQVQLTSRNILQSLGPNDGKGLTTLSPNLKTINDAAGKLKTARQEVEEVIGFLQGMQITLPQVQEDEQNAKTAINTIQGILRNINNEVGAAIGTDKKSKDDLEALVDEKISDATLLLNPKDPEDISKQINEAKTEAQQAQEKAQEACNKAKQVRDSEQTDLNDVSDYLEYIDESIEETGKEIEHLEHELQKVDGKPKKKSSTSEEPSEITASDDEFHEDEEAAKLIATQQKKTTASTTQQEQDADNDLDGHDNLSSGDKSIDNADLSHQDDQ